MIGQGPRQDQPLLRRATPRRPKSAFGLTGGKAAKALRVPFRLPARSGNHRRHTGIPAATVALCGSGFHGNGRHARNRAALPFHRSQRTRHHAPGFDPLIDLQHPRAGGKSRQPHFQSLWATRAIGKIHRVGRHTEFVRLADRQKAPVQPRSQRHPQHKFHGISAAPPFQSRPHPGRPADRQSDPRVPRC